MKKIITILAVVIITLSIFISPVSATEKLVRSTADNSFISVFSDVPKNSPYAESINAMVKLGIIAGVGNNRFAPNETVSYEQLRIMLSRIYGNGNPDDYIFPSVYEFAAKYAAEHGYFVNWNALTAIALRTAKIPFFAYKSFNNPIYENDEANFAAVMGLMEKNKTSPYVNVTRAECVDFLYKFMNCSVLPIPESISQFSKVVIEDVENSYYVRSLAAVEAKLIPDIFIDIFNQAGYTLIFSDSVDKYYDNVSIDGRIGGVTFSVEKIVVLFSTYSEKTALYHELGHVVTNETGMRYSGKLDEVWKYDSEGIKELTGEYSQTDTFECWAEAFAYMLRNQNDIEKMALAKEKMPISYEYYNSLFQSHE